MQCARAKTWTYVMLTTWKVRGKYSLKIFNFLEVSYKADFTQKVSNQTYRQRQRFTQCQLEVFTQSLTGRCSAWDMFGWSKLAHHLNHPLSLVSFIYRKRHDSYATPHFVRRKNITACNLLPSFLSPLVRKIWACSTLMTS